MIATDSQNAQNKETSRQNFTNTTKISKLIRDEKKSCKEMYARMAHVTVRNNTDTVSQNLKSKKQHQTC